jgi:hypothetical protein
VPRLVFAIIGARLNAVEAERRGLGTTSGQQETDRKRSPSRSRSQVSGVKHYPYNLNSLAGQLEAIVVEGAMDCLSMAVADFQNVVSVPNGAPATPQNGSSRRFEFLTNSTPY